MDEATLDRIFEPFFTTRPDGNGLGLATARDIVREHNGALQVKSAVGAGTRFEIWLPTLPSHQPIFVQHASGNAGRGVGETVLVLEADRGRLLRHEEILAALGYEPVGFTGLQEAAQACAVHARFDAALLCHQPARASLSISPLPCASSRPTCRSSWRRLRHGISMRDCWRFPVFPRWSIIL
jgi:hypothetical protein